MRALLIVQLLALLLFYYGIQTKAMLWQITGNGLQKPSYLFGTYHTYNKELNNLKPIVYQSLGSSQYFYSEIKFNPQSLKKITQLMTLQKPLALNKRLNPSTITHIKSYLKKNQLSSGMNALSRYKTWAIALQLANSSVKNTASEMFFMDEALIHLAKEQNKKHTALESPAEQLKYFDDLTHAQQELFLLESISDGAHNFEAKLNRWYKRGDLEDFNALKKEATHKNLEALMQNLIDKRNHIFTARILDHLQTHTDISHFFAIGAGHLANKSGVLNSLQKAGYTLIQLD